MMRSLCNHIPNIINLSKDAKSYCPDTNTLTKYQSFDLKVKGQTEVTMEHDTPSMWLYNDHSLTLTFDLEVKYFT
jgi:hypothetical protein